ncbi:hypothetical protein JYK22_37645, partial [Nonomuraea sp. RK-328]|nr:hypothetical protein [Nonomuraea sp. RK-328]
VHVGPSSRDLPLERRVHLDPEVPPTPLAADSTLEEWLAHPRGQEIVREIFARAAGGGPDFLGDPATRSLIAQIPLATLLGMGAGRGGERPPSVEDLLRLANS